MMLKFKIKSVMVCSHCVSLSAGDMASPRLFYLLDANQAD